MREGWKQIKLGDIIHIKHGYGFKGEYFVEEPNNNILVTPGNFAIGGGFKDDKMKYYDGPINEEFVLSEGDVIVTMTDLSKQADTLGYSAKVPKDDINTYLHNQRIGLVSLLSKDYDLDFIYWLLRTHAYQRYIAGSSSGATVKHTSPKKIYSTKLTVPKSKETQRKIASILSAYDDLIENNLKRIKLLEEQAQLTYEEWFVRFKFPGYETVKFDEETGLPEGWERNGLGKFTDIKKGKNITKATIVQGNVPVIAGGLKPAYYHNKPNTINPVITVSASGANAGYTAIQLEDVWASDCSFIDSSMTKYLHFVYCTMISNQPKIYHFQKGAAQPHVYPKDLVKLEVIIPSIEMIQLFEDFAKNIFDSIRIFNKQNQLLKEARDMLLPRLMSGLIDVEKLEVGSLKYKVNDSLGMVAEENNSYGK